MPPPRRNAIAAGLRALAPLVAHCHLLSRLSIRTGDAAALPSRRRSIREMDMRLEQAETK
jgi:hypothetical protein